MKTKKLLTFFLSLVLIMGILFTLPLSVSAKTSDLVLAQKTQEIDDNYEEYTTASGFEYKIVDNAAVITGYTEDETDIVIPDKIEGYSVLAIDDYAFSWQDDLLTVKIPEGITSIGEYAFAWCGSLTSVEIPESVTDLGLSSFQECTHLTKITIPKSVKEIADGTFRDCTSLKTINLHKNISSIGQEAFYNTAFYNDESNWDNSGLYSQNYLIQVKNDIKGAYRINEDTSVIADGAFFECNELTSVVIPKSVTNIGSGAFSCCSNLSSIKVDENNAIYDSRNNCNAIIETSTNTLVQGCYSTVIPYSVTKIGEGAFSGCTNLIRIKIPDSVTVIENGAFFNCRSLLEINIPKGVKSINALTFAKCTDLKNINIPDNITSIGYHAFYRCTNLESVVIPDSVTEIPYGLFVECTNLKNVVIPKNVTEIGSFAFYKCTSLESVVIPDGVTQMPYCGFDYCKNLKSATIGRGVTNFNSSMLGYYYDDESGEAIKVEGLVIHGYKGSAAEAYANDNGIKFIEGVEQKYQLGDVNKDGKITITDATAIQRWCSDMVTFTAEQEKLADFNKNNKTNISDVTAIQKYLANTK